MLTKLLIWICAGLAGLAAVSLTCAAQTAQAPAQLKQIGVPSNAKPELTPSLIVMNAQGATLQSNTLTLVGVSPTVVTFADRPIRAAGHALTAHLIEEWGRGRDSFAQDPPNATVSAFNKDASTVKEAVVELTSPRLEGQNLVFNVKVLEGDLAGADGPASVFIDIIGLPFTPLSFAGAARRTAARGAWYAGYSAAAAPYEPGASLGGRSSFPMPWQ